MYASQDCGHIIGRAPSILQDIQTQLAGAIDVGMEHLADEFDARWLVGVLLLELHHESESAVLKWRICRPDDDSVPLEEMVLGVFVLVDLHGG